MMSVSTMRVVDSLVGVPICAALTIIRKLSDLARRPKSEPVRRIAFLKLVEQGTTVVAYTTLKRAIEMVGRENVYFVVFEENRFILDTMEMIPPENVIAIRSKGIGTVTADVFRALYKMRKLHIDTVIDIEFFARSSAILGYLSGASRRVGFQAYGGEGPYRGDLLTHRLRYNPHIHASQTFRMVIDAVNAPAEELPTFNILPDVCEELPPPFKPKENETNEVKTILRQNLGSEKFEPLILLNANCSDLLTLRRWSDKNYIELAKRLLEKYPELHIALTGSPSEAAAVSGLVNQVGSQRCFSMAGKTTLRQLMVVYMLSEVLVTNDSGPAHFATLTNIDVVTLFGPEYPKLFAARSPRNHVFWAGIVCSPCVSVLNNRTSPCKNNVCMQRINVEDVFKEVCRLYEVRRCAKSSQ
jgi:ADP-heptose:LPS heptosyltransferase